MNLIKSYFFIIGIFLLYNLIKDIKYEKIDSRYNYAMLGATILFFSYLNKNILYFILSYFMSFVVISFLKDIIKEGDVIPIIVITMTSFMLHFVIFLFWTFHLFIFTTLYLYLMKKNKVDKMPFFPIIFISYITSFYYYLW